MPKTKQQEAQEKRLQANIQQARKNRSAVKKAGKKSGPHAKPPGKGGFFSGVKRDAPQTAQQTIPYREIYKDGICRVNNKLYTKTIQFFDINYQLAQADDKAQIFENYCDFLNYFNRAFKKKRDTEEARERAEAYRGGIKISDDDDKKIRKILRLAKSSGKDLNDPSLIRKIAEVMHVCEREVVALIRINADAAAVPSTVRNDDGDETELFDTLASDEPAADAALISAENVREIADELQRVFDTVQERQKKALSMMLTARYILACDCDYDQADRLLYGRQFYDRGFAEECRISGAAPTDAAIAEKCGVLPSSLSRTFKEFKKKFIKG